MKNEPFKSWIEAPKPPSKAEAKKQTNVARLTLREKRHFLWTLQLVREVVAKHWASGGVLSAQDAILLLQSLLGDKIAVAPGAPVDIPSVSALADQIKDRMEEREEQMRFHFDLYKSEYEEIFSKEEIEAL